LRSAIGKICVIVAIRLIPLEEWGAAGINVEGATDEADLADAADYAWVREGSSRQAMDNFVFRVMQTTFGSCFHRRPISPDPPNPPHLSHPSTLMSDGQDRRAPGVQVVIRRP
jgi:hypothetical protein